VYDSGCAVGAAVVNDKDMKTFFESEDGSDDFLNVLLLVVSGNNDDAVARIHICYTLVDAKVEKLFQTWKKRTFILLSSLFSLLCGASPATARD
jgi:hypothetical protein